MMFFLILNIMNCFFDNRLADGKGCITTLPCKLSIMTPHSLNPTAAITLHLLNEVGDILGF